MTGPTQFEEYPGGVFLHGTKADLKPGDRLTPGVSPNFNVVLGHVYFTQTLDAAVWGAELATGDLPERIYVVEPTGEYEDDPNLTDKRFPGNPTRSFRSADAITVVGEITEWEGHDPEQIQAMRAGLNALEASGEDTIIN